jgi:uncharacterized protein YegP (UPF0339 family)
VGKFTISESSEGYSFLFQNAKGEILGLSPFYGTKLDAEKGIYEILRESVSAPIRDEVRGRGLSKPCPRFSITKDDNEMYHIAFYGKGGDVVLNGAVYTSLQHAYDAIALIRYNVSGIEQK